MNGLDELTADDLEEQYDDAIIDDFCNVTHDFQTGYGFDNASMIRLLEEAINVIKKSELI